MTNTRISELRSDTEVVLRGMVHQLKNLGGVQFLTLRLGQGTLQCVLTQAVEGLSAECAVELRGKLREEARAPGGVELAVEELSILSSPTAPPPVPIAKYNMRLNLGTTLQYRPVALRNLQQRKIFQTQAELVRAFRAHVEEEGFTEIHSPKIVSAGAEGGSNIFRLDYFGSKAYLAQSPQFYKQMMVAVFERVFEIGPVFRAEKHATTRHLAEYTSMDLECAFLDSMDDLMDLEEGFLRRLIPTLAPIPRLRFSEVKQLAAQAYGHRVLDPYDLTPEEEHAIGRYAKEHMGSDFVFVTHYPAKKRPFYARNDPEDARFTRSFDLLCKGVEVTTGGERIHDYQELVEKMEQRGMDIAEFEDYLLAFRCGMPPHGGLGIGLERLTMQFLDLENVREATLFPRDRTRLTP